MFASKDLFFTRPSGYQISRSVRLRSSATAYFNRTPAAASNRKTWTWSGWVKRGTLGTRQILFSCWAAGNDNQRFFIEFGSNYGDELDITAFSVSWRATTQLFRDPAAWYHIVVNIDTTQATAANRIKTYVNGTQITSFAVSNDPALNADLGINQAAAHNIGQSTSNSIYFDGYMAEVNFIDGQALTPSSFGQYNANGVWSPIKYAGTYGTNGFYLNFSDNSGVTATTIGKDNSGNGNNWTPNNISVTAGTTYDSMLDSPTPYADGGNGRGNYPVMNPLANTGITVTDGNLSVQRTSASFANIFGSFQFPSSGKYYFETTIVSSSAGNNQQMGITGLSTAYGFVLDCFYSGSLIRKVVDGTVTTGYGTAANGGVIGVAIDCDNSKAYLAYNNTFIDSSSPTGGTGGYSFAAGQTYFAFFSGYNSGVSAYNFGQRPFSYTPPTGFVALNTQNLSTPTIANGAAYMAATTYTGTGASLTIANTVNSASFQPDFVWVKGRSGATDHALYDSVRGTTLDLVSNTTAAETTQTTGLTAFGSTGFTVGALAKMNTSAATYVGWQWKAGTTSASNTSGTITSTVSVGATQGFSVVTWTNPTTSNFTIGHGLGVAPKMIITKVRSATSGWVTYHASLGNTYALTLNSTAAQDNSVSYFNSTSPTSTVFTLGTVGIYGSSVTMVAYCFSEVAGFSKFGSYTGNGSADGPFIYTGFRPRWVLIKSSSGVADWFEYDTSINAYNQVSTWLRPNYSGAEVTNTAQAIDIVSNGFKLRGSDTGVNASAGTFIYACFAENPFKYSLAR